MPDLTLKKIKNRFKRMDGLNNEGLYCESLRVNALMIKMPLTKSMRQRAKSAIEKFGGKYHG